MAGSGTRTRLITLSRDGAEMGRNEFNEPVYGPAVRFDRLASREDASDGERFAAGQIGSFLMARFVVLSDPDTRRITPVYRLVHEGASFNITSVKEAMGGRRQFIEITATKDADHGV